MRVVAFLCLAVVWRGAAPAVAVDAEKLDGATVVQGTVRAVFRDEDGDETGTVTYLYEVGVEKAERAKPGDDLKAGKVVYARAVHLGRKVEIPKGVSPPLAFIMVRPGKGDTVRVHCERRDDGLYRVLSNVSALQVVKPAKER